MTLRHALLAAVILFHCDGLRIRLRYPRRGPGTNRMDKGRESLHQSERREDEAAVEGEAREHAARDAQLFQPAHLGNVTTAQGAREMAVVAGVSDDLFGIDVASGELVWKKHFDGAPAGSGGPRQHALPRRSDCHPSSERALRPAEAPPSMPVVGRPVEPGGHGDGPGRGPPGEVPARQREAGHQPVKRRHLHGERAGMRRQSERVLLVRSGHEESEHLPPRRRRTVGPPRRGCRSRGARLHGHRRRAVRSDDAESRQRDRRREDGREQADAARGLLRAEERQLDAAARSRRERDADGVRLQGHEVPHRHEQGVPIWVLDREALGGEDHRTPLYTSPLLCNDIQAFDAKGVWGSLAHGRTGPARSG